MYRPDDFVSSYTESCTVFVYFDDLVLMYLLLSSYLLGHISHALSTPFCFASSPSNDISPGLYHPLAGQHRCILVFLVSSFLVLDTIAITFLLFRQLFSTHDQ